jgi:hypothetical protein
VSALAVLTRKASGDRRIRTVGRVHRHVGDVERAVGRAKPKPKPNSGLMPRRFRLSPWPPVGCRRCSGELPRDRGGRVRYERASRSAHPGQFAQPCPRLGPPGAFVLLRAVIAVAAVVVWTDLRTLAASCLRPLTPLYGCGWPDTRSACGSAPGRRRVLTLSLFRYRQALRSRPAHDRGGGESA